ncbi:MAG: 3-hydroxyacyl-CoA dehydrogenase family protein, partial [Bacteroidota bacterium]
PATSPDVVQFLMDFGGQHLGKTTVLCKDTPAFIANRIGVFSIQFLFHAVRQMGLTIEEVDKLSGPVMGRPKSATFRTCDVVGLDTLIHVAKGLQENCPDDEQAAVFRIPDYVEHLAAKGWIGDKTNRDSTRSQKTRRVKKKFWHSTSTPWNTDPRKRSASPRWSRPVRLTVSMNARALSTPVMTSQEHFIARCFITSSHT